jgi:hypothetical protein
MILEIYRWEVQSKQTEQNIPETLTHRTHQK